MRRDFNKKQLDEVTTKINDKIEEIKSNVLIKVTQSLENELEKIESLIENFEGAEFHSNKIEKYRNELIKHVENGFSNGIQSVSWRVRLSTDRTEGPWIPNLDKIWFLIVRAHLLKKSGRFSNFLSLGEALVWSKLKTFSGEKKLKWYII